MGNLNSILAWQKEAERASVLASARDQYGPTCAYFWHDCGHDASGARNGPCTREAV